MPAIGFGCAFYDWQGVKTEGAEGIVRAALAAGYRNLDTARSWDSEAAVGNALAEHVKAGSLKREEVFISTKVCHPEETWVSTYKRPKGLGFHFEDAALDVHTKVASDIAASLANLRVEYVDLLLCHWPGNYESQAPTNRTVRKEIWLALEAARKQGLTRAIGVCNFAVHHLEGLIADTGITPAVAHMEGHPYCIDEELVSFCNSHGIMLVCHSPFASGNLFEESLDVFEDAVLQELATKYHRTVAQVILRWLLQRGFAVLPKSKNRDRMASNLETSFILEPVDIERINALNANKRVRPDPKKIA